MKKETIQKIIENSIIIAAAITIVVSIIIAAAITIAVGIFAFNLFGG